MRYLCWGMQMWVTLCLCQVISDLFYSTDHFWSDTVFFNSTLYPVCYHSYRIFHFAPKIIGNFVWWQDEASQDWKKRQGRSLPKKQSKHIEMCVKHVVPLGTAQLQDVGWMQFLVLWEEQVVAILCGCRHGTCADQRCREQEGRQLLPG